jgi:hypothetical protein
MKSHVYFYKGQSFFFLFHLFLCFVRKTQSGFKFSQETWMKLQTAIRDCFVLSGKLKNFSSARLPCLVISAYDLNLFDSSFHKNILCLKSWRTNSFLVSTARQQRKMAKHAKFSDGKWAVRDVMQRGQRQQMELALKKNVKFMHDRTIFV